MNGRQYKKLCKKSAEIIGFDKCCDDVGDEVWNVVIPDAYDEDSTPAWDFIVERFHYDVNRIGADWVSDSEFTKPTPANVFAWARKQEWK